MNPGLLVHQTTKSTARLLFLLPFPSGIGLFHAKVSFRLEKIGWVWSIWISVPPSFLPPPLKMIKLTQKKGYLGRGDGA